MPHDAARAESPAFTSGRGARQYLEIHDRDGRPIIVGNRTRGWHDGQYDEHRYHGHGLFHRGMMSHAIAHADPAFFTPVRRGG
ncbi:hypothetical protein ACFFWE_02620 [Sphaerisporangium melleum]|uniref:Uncharacterized protein n=1 Tax=Sphaerisporangium melleum TaxID=321316 RepID=A0A917QXM2_9ACTN|nr:hypothetical protein [Sphaerisporangium melleum]GGK76433.1 hypothetical protein GCM10007964_18990 [Sphaerisporangium melleum]